MSQGKRIAAIAASLALIAGQAFAQAKPAADAPQAPDPKALQAIVDAFAGGLPEKWDRAWVIVGQVRNEGGARDYDVLCLFKEPGGDDAGKPIASCDRKAVFENVYSLNRNITDLEKRRWTRATVIFMPDGKFELKYDYPEDEKPAAEKKG